MKNIFIPIESITNKIPTKNLINKKVTVLGLGGQGTIQGGKEKDGIEIIQRAFDLGINYYDTSRIYANSEVRIGKALKGIKRNKYILASKTHERGYDDAMRELEESLTNLKTDHLDLWQMHSINTQEGINSFLKGASKAFIKAKEEGIVKNLGVSCHLNAKLLMNCVNRFDFDTALIPVHPADIHGPKSQSFSRIIPLLKQKGLGLIGMKIFSRGANFEYSKYKAKDYLNYAWTKPIDTVIVGIKTLKELEENVLLAKSFKPTKNNIMTKMEAAFKDAYKDVLFFKLFDKKSTDEITWRWPD
jgi:uncharacterized protein